MNTKIIEQTAVQQAKTQEYAVSVDGVIEIEEYLDPKAIFDGLLDVIIEYIEKHNAMAGLTMTYEKYVKADDDTIVQTYPCNKLTRIYTNFNPFSQKFVLIRCKKSLTA